MAESEGDTSGSSSSQPPQADLSRQDSFVEQLRPDPARPAKPVRELVGLFGHSDRPGYHRLYVSRALDYYLEFRAADVVYRRRVPREEHPLVGVEASVVGVKEDAEIEYTRVSTADALDEFDLDVRLPAQGMITESGRTGNPWDPRQTHRTACEPCTWNAACPGTGGTVGGGGTREDTARRHTCQGRQCVTIARC